ncbi:hypothetical protein HanIR_Chr13g0670371 [Helianthus annuus]|nr:hypothetical protein HanIR_Chr13g0670371 [Helianthus annuus]
MKRVKRSKYEKESVIWMRGDKYNKGFGSNYGFQHKTNWVGTNRNVLNHD